MDYLLTSISHMTDMEEINLNPCPALLAVSVLVVNAPHRTACRQHCLSTPFITGVLCFFAWHISRHRVSTLAPPSPVLAGAQVVFQVLSQFLLKALSIASARCMHNTMLRQLLRCARGDLRAAQFPSHVHHLRPASTGRAGAPC